MHPSYYPVEVAFPRLGSLGNQWALALARLCRALSIIWRLPNLTQQHTALMMSLLPLRIEEKAYWETLVSAAIALNPSGIWLWFIGNQ